MRSFALVTACCSQTLYASTVDDDSDDASGTNCRHNDQQQQKTADAFLSASRDMLIHCEPADVARPSSISLAIRVVQAAALHGQGQIRMAGYVVGQAVRLALDMRLHDEASLSCVSQGDSDGAARSEAAREAQLRRNLFWVLYAIDKSISLVSDSGSPSLTLFPGNPSRMDMENSPDRPRPRLLRGMGRAGVYTAEFEDSLRHGFEICSRQWLFADSIVRMLDLLASLGRGRGDETGGVEALEPLSGRITADYISLCGLFDTAPSYVRDPHCVDAKPLRANHMHPSPAATTTTTTPNDDVNDNDNDGQGQRKQQQEQQRRTTAAYWSQHVNLLVTQHCLKMLVFVRAARYGQARMLGGVDGDERLIALRNVEVAAELVAGVERVPMKALKANGEALVSVTSHSFLSLPLSHLLHILISLLYIRLTSRAEY